MMRIHIVGRADTFDSIAKQYQIEVERLRVANPQIPARSLNLSGAAIRIPGPLPSADAGHAFSCPPVEPAPYLDHWIPLASLHEMEETEYDVIVIGTGMGGGAALWRLCEQYANTGKRIGVVEKGDLFLQTHHWNVPTLDNERAARLFANPGISCPVGKTLPQFSGARELYALGGRTLFWGVVSPRVHHSELPNWPLSQKEIDLYYNIAESVMDVSNAYSKDSSITNVLLNRLWNNGFPDAAPSPMAIDLNPTKYGEIHSNSAFSSISFLAKALNFMPFDLAVKAPATRIITHNGKVVGVEVKNAEKRPFFLRSKTIVLATSALDAPRLLLHSAIPGRAIGHFLTNHSFVLTNGVLRTTNFPEVLGTLAVLIPSSLERPYQVQVQGPGPYYWYHDTEKEMQEEWGFNFFGGFGRVESRFENHVYLDHNRHDEYGVPKIGVSFAYSEKDKFIIRQMESGIRQIASAAGVRLTGTNGQPNLCLMPPGADYHEFGTCRMGNDPSTSATNRYGQIHGISGLYVAGNSVLPSIGAANPSLTAAAMAIRTADYIVQSQ